MDINEKITDLLAAGETFCLATVVASSTKGIPAGTKTLILYDGSVDAGTGKAALDSLLRQHALHCLEKRKKITEEIQPGLRVFFDILSESVQLVICGAGHIAVPLARYGRDLGFAVTVVDDRGDFANSERFPGCDIRADDFVPVLRGMPLGKSTSVVVITRGHEHDAECLAEVLKKQTAYVGLIGSRRRVRFVLEMLAGEGIAPERLGEVFTPIGLPIGAESPEEIAVSIMAELVCVRKKGERQAHALRNSIRTMS